MTNGVLAHYSVARDRVLRSEHRAEIARCAAADSTRISEAMFLRETAWVILSSGFRASVVTNCFQFLSLAYFDFSSARLIDEKADACVRIAKRRFSNEDKLNAMVSAARLVLKWPSFEAFRSDLQDDYQVTLCEIPFVGPVTVRHLARNLGFDVAKPDRHLRRVTERFGFNDTDSMCRYISWHSGDAVRVVDAVLWRAAVMDAEGLLVGRRQDGSGGLSGCGEMADVAN